MRACVCVLKGDIFREGGGGGGGQSASEHYPGGGGGGGGTIRYDTGMHQCVQNVNRCFSAQL